jgi:exonuclease VII small subunit
MSINNVIGQVTSEFYKAMKAADRHIANLETDIAELEKEVQLYQEFVLHCKDKHGVPDVCCPYVP